MYDHIGIKVRDLMTRDVVTVSLDLPVSALMNTMLREHHLGFPVVSATGELRGMVALDELQGVDPNASIGQVMKRDPATISENASALEAFQLMSRNNFGRLVVTNDRGQMVGIITKTDLMQSNGIIHVIDTVVLPS